MMITAKRYRAGMSETLDRILNPNDTVWVVRRDNYAPELIVADTALGAIRAYAHVLKVRAMPPTPPRESNRIRRKPE